MRLVPIWVIRSPALSRRTLGQRDAPTEAALPRLCPIKELWEASPTPILHCNTMRCSVATISGSEIPPTNIFGQKHPAPGWLHDDLSWHSSRGRGRAGDI